MKNGLTPKTNNKKFSYPDRIYFFLREPDTEDCLWLMKQFYKSEIESFKNGRIKRVYNGTYTLLKIDTELVKNVDFSYDPNTYESIYTY